MKGLPQRLRGLLSQSHPPERGSPVHIPHDPAAAVEADDDEPGTSTSKLPEGRYVFVAPPFTTTFGGLTSSMFARARAFVANADTPLTIVSFGSSSDIDDFRQVMSQQGVVPDEGVRLLSLHEDYATRHYTVAASSGPRPLPEHRASVTERYADGLPSKRILVEPMTGETIVEDYLRRSGKSYLRRWVESREDGMLSTTLVECLDGEDGLRATYPSIPALYRAWFEETFPLGEAPTFVVVDSAASARYLLPVRRPDVIRFFVVHGAHLTGNGRYDSRLGRKRAHMFTNLARVDGLILLTEGQKRDVELRYGFRNNLFVVPHSVRPLPECPDEANRDPKRIVVVGRLSPEKRIAHAVLAFRKVLESVPEASLDVYGSGDRQEALEALVTELGLDGRVTFHGHVAGAARNFESAGLTVLTSKSEGQGLVILEAMAAGCPVVSYDIKYGPSDMVEDGTTGYLVNAGDVDALAERMTVLLLDPELARRMGRAGWERAHNFDEAHMVRTWSDAFTTALRQRPRQVFLKRVRLDCAESDKHGQVSCTLRVDAEVPQRAVNDWIVRLLLVARNSAERLEFEVDARPEEQEEGNWVFDIHGSVNPGTIRRWLRGLGETDFDAFVDLTWNNSHWRGRLPESPAVQRGRG